MRILRRCSALLALLLLAACDGQGTLPVVSGPIVGEWVAPTEPPLTNQAVDRAEWRLDYREDGTYLSQILWMDGDAVVYRHEAAGEFRVEAGAVSQNVRTWRHWTADRGTWQNEYVARPDEFGPPVPYSAEGGRLTLYYSHSFNEHGIDRGPWQAVFSRR